MLRSMIVGLAVAAVLQVATAMLSASSDVAMTAQRIDWVKVQTEALSRLVYDGYTLLTR